MSTIYDGDTALPTGSPWTLEGPHDGLEDSILAKVDAERGHEPVRRMSAVNEGMRGIRLTVDGADKVFRAQLGKFLDRLVHIMISADEDGGGSATRAYVVAREMQMVLAKTRRHEVLLSPEGARALATELEAYLSADAVAGLGNIRRQLFDALGDRRRQRRKTR